MARPKILSAAFVKTISDPGRYGDGRGSYGLYLRVWVMTNGRIGKNWGQRLRIGGQLTNLGLGSYPQVSLALARGRAIENAQLVAEGGDPRKPLVTIPTFAKGVSEVIDLRSKRWKNPKTTKRWRSVLEAYAMPVLANMPISEIRSSHVMEVLTPIWVEKPETGRQVREHISMVMEWAKVEGHRNDNPADKAILKALPKHGRKNHYKALPFAELRKAIGTVRSTYAHPATKLAFEFIAFTACRSGEARLATWDEFDLSAATWTIPASKMKNGLEHRVPLSNSTLDVLGQARELGNGAGLVFPSARGKLMSDSTVSKLLRDNNIQTTPHGLRSAFRDWAAECSDQPREIAEYALAHIEGSAAELAYRRTDYFDRRRKLMEDWALYLNGTEGIVSAGRQQ